MLSLDQGRASPLIINLVVSWARANQALGRDSNAILGRRGLRGTVTSGLRLLADAANAGGRLARSNGPKVGTAAKYSNDRTINSFGLIQMCPAQREHGYERLLRGVRDEAVVGSNRAGIVQVG